MAMEYVLDSGLYTRPEAFATEKERIFFRTWQYAAHASQLRNPGDFVAFSICDQNLFVMRGVDDEIRAFYNVCQHRAHHLLSGVGNTKLIVCPYHAWSYEADGRLRRAPNSNSVEGFDTGSICLTSVNVEVFAGFVFVNLDPQARSMSEWYPEVEQELRAHVPQIDRLQPLQTLAENQACNWKVSVENYSECYHCRVVHKTFTQGVVDPVSYNILPQGHCLRHTASSAGSMSYTISNDNPYAQSYSSWFLWPAFSFQVYPGNVLNTYLWRANGVDHTEVSRGWYSLDGAQDDELLKLAQQDFETTFAEDVLLVESVQRGLNSKGYNGGPLVIDRNNGVSSEHSIKALKQWVLESLAEV